MRLSTHFAVYYVVYVCARVYLMQTIVINSYTSI